MRIVRIEKDKDCFGEESVFNCYLAEPLGKEDIIKFESKFKENFLYYSHFPKPFFKVITKLFMINGFEGGNKLQFVFNSKVKDTQPLFRKFHKWFH